MSVETNPERGLQHVAVCEACGALIVLPVAQTLACDGLFTCRGCGHDHLVHPEDYPRFGAAAAADRARCKDDFLASHPDLWFDQMREQRALQAYEWADRGRNVKVEPPALFTPISRRGVCDGCRDGRDKPVRTYLTEDYRAHVFKEETAVPLVKWHCASCIAAINATLPRPVFGGPLPEFRYGTEAPRPLRARRVEKG